MDGVFGGLMKAARRTAQPYAFTLRAAVGYIIVAALLLLCLSLIRLTFLAPPTDAGPQVPSSVVASPAPQRSVLVVAEESLPDYARAIVDHLSAALLISIIAALLVIFITTKNQDDRHLKAIEPWNIHPALMDALAQTRTYWFRGRSGRFLRDTVLPELNDSARKEATQRDVRLSLPDPRDGKTMNRYADYRNSMAMSATDSWTADRIRNEVLATILCAAEIRANNQFMEIEISLSSSFALYRTDMSDRKLIMTREEPKWPALMCSAGSVFYDSFLEEMRIAHKLGTPLQLSALEFGRHVEIDQIPTILESIGLKGLSLTPQECAAIRSAMEKKSSPYV